jgi:UDP-N-acetylmuramyl pentapeptide synthase
MIEITGARGKTTTAHALAGILPGPGVLHTSIGTYTCPEQHLLFRKSITPASEIAAAEAALRMDGWLVAETSLGVTGAGDLAIITSPDTYTFAGGKKTALIEKIASARHAKCLLVADNIACEGENVVHVSDVARCEGMECTVEWQGARQVLTNPLFLLPPYRTPLMLAAAAAMILNTSPAPLRQFSALPGRLSTSYAGNRIIVDNANSGTNVTTTLCAARYARACARAGELTLVIGQEEGAGAVCEGFSVDQIAAAIDQVRPAHVIWVGRYPEPGTIRPEAFRGLVDAVCTTLEEGRSRALQIASSGPIVLSVKTWR